MDKAGERKRKVYFGESELSSSSFHLKTRRVAAANSGGLSCQTVTGDDCSSNGSGELTKETWKFVDLEDSEATGDSLGCESETEAGGESDELESTEADPRRRSMPSESELDEFFAAAEKKIQQKFIDKYNYDVVKEQSLEGRYEWVK
ncbi:cyclin-dependent kinase inhibitor 7-like [Salvia divinorum]|uniref:Cyclin-dependent kinase inhibitor 7-like n=1 Tax=Salvia divinorum TaxID=28513 RepID=A0ABD1GD03_SALDI